MKKSLYQILGVQQNATATAIADAHARLLDDYQTRQQQGDANATNDLIGLAGAYEILSNPAKRDAYDEMLAAKQFQPRQIEIAKPITSARAAIPTKNENTFFRDGNGNPIAAPTRSAATANPKLASCRTCGKEVSRTARTCPHCGEENPVKIAIAAQQTASTQRASNVLVTIITFVGILFFVAYKLRSPGGGDVTPVVSVPRYDEANAQVECEKYVRRELKTPAKAEFSPRRDLTITGSGNGPWTVFGYVDSQNSYGAMLRSNYSCTVSFDGDRVTLQDVKLF